MGGIPIFHFFDPGVLQDGDLSLKLIETRPADIAKGWAPTYFFNMVNTETGETAGQIRLRVGDNELIQLYAGNVGYEVAPQYRGHRFAARSLRLLFPIARQHGLKDLCITCDPENIPSRRTCEIAGAVLVDIIDVPEHIHMRQEGVMRKCRYRLILD